MRKLKLIRMTIRSAQNVGKVLISRTNKKLPASFGVICGKSVPWVEQMQNVMIFGLFSLVVQWGPIYPVWGHVLVSYDLPGDKQHCYHGLLKGCV